MAVAGDVVIKLAADVADLKKGLADATGAINDLKKTAEEASANVGSITAGVTKGNLLADVIKIAVDEMKQLIVHSEQASLQIAKQADALKLGAAQFQAYQLIAKATGLSVAEVTKQLKGNADQTQRAIDYYKSLGLIIDQEAIAKFVRMDAAAEESKRKIDAVIAPLYAEAKETVLDAIATALTRIKSVLDSMDMTKIDTLLKLVANPGKFFSEFGARIGAGLTEDPLPKQLEKLDDQIVKTINNLNRLRQGGPNIYAGDILPEQQKLDQLQEQRRQLAAKAGSDESRPFPNLPPEMRLQLMDPTTVTSTRGGGGGGKTDAESMDAQIARYRALGVAAKESYDKVVAAHLPLVEDVEREMRVQSQIDQIAARLGARYSNALPEQKQLLHDVVTEWERAKEASGEYLKNLQAAEEVNARLGSGAQARRDERAFARAQAGGAEPRALERLRREQQRSREAQERNAARLDDDFGSLGAGFEDAMAKYSEANDLFTSGAQGFQAVIDSLGQSFEILAGRSSKSFEQVAADFASMLAKIALQMAVSQAFKFLMNLVGPSVTAAAAPAGGYSATIDPVTGMGNITTRAGGGDVYAGNVYRVGEYGPETFVPAASGRIEPYSASNGGGGVTVNLDMKKAEGAPNAEAALEFGRRVKAAVVSVISTERRPGGSLYTSATGLAS